MVVEAKSRSSGARRTRHFYVNVPLGTIVRDADTDEVILFEVTEDQQEVVLLRGGKGGLGKLEF